MTLTAAVWAVTSQEVVGLSWKILAIVGGAAVGAFLAGMLGKLGTRMLTTKPMPLWGVRVLRLFGGVAAGWLIALWVLSGGGWGIGGPGGPGIGANGEDPSANNKKTEDAKKSESDKPPKEEVVVIEVLGDNTLKQLGRANSSPYEGYRIQGEEKLYTLKKLRDELLTRRKQYPGLKVRDPFELNDDSPPPSHPDVTSLKDELKKHNLLQEKPPPGSKRD